MKKFQLRAPSATTVIALIALFLAAGGTSYAAAKLASVKVVGSVPVTNGNGALHIDGNVGISGGNVGVNGPVDPTPEHVLASGVCTDNAGHAVTATVPNTAGRRIMSIVVSQPYVNSGTPRLAMYAPGANTDPVSGTPLIAIYGGEISSGESLPNSLSFGPGLAAPTGGNWTFRCGSTDNYGQTSAMWMALGV